MFTKKHGRALVAAAILSLASAGLPMPATAMPIFAQRYHLQCGACHRVLPELNDFGNAFRNRGYRLPLPKRGTTVAALRYQLEWDQNPSDSTRKWNPAGVVLASEDVGRITAYLHYNLGAGGGPAGTYLAYIATYNEHTQTLYRIGEYEMPLPHSPGQRLDDLAPYGYEATRVGLNNLLFTQPRIGLEAERVVGDSRIMATVAGGEFQGSAYGGKPVVTGETSSAAAPEIGVYGTFPIAGTTVYTETLEGARAIAQTGRQQFTDGYWRQGLAARVQRGNVELLAQQWWGHDANADGFGNAIGSSGGFARLRYFLGSHAFLAARYDTAANPVAIRDWVVYAEAQVFGHARFLIETKHTWPPKQTTLEGAMTIALPWPWGL